MITFDPGAAPAYSYGVAHAWPTSETRFEKPYAVREQRTIRPIRAYRHVWPGMTRAQLDYTLSFFHEVGAGEFLWRPIDPQWGPRHRAPDLDGVDLAGNPASARDYDVAFSWYEPTDDTETPPSPSGSIHLESGFVVAVTVPIFPLGVSAARIYAADTGGQLYSQGYTTERLWTQPQADIQTLTDIPRTVGTLRPAVRCYLAEDFEPVRRGPSRWQVQLTFQELHV